jgi:hypothetical protein
VGGQLAAATAAYFMCQLRLTHSLSWSALLGSAITRILAVCGVAAAMTWALGALFTEGSTRDFRRLALRTALDSSWLVPLALFLRENSIWALFVAALVVARVANSFLWIDDRSPRADAERPRTPGEDRMFSLLGSAHRFWRQASAIAAALCAQIGVLASFGGNSLNGAVLVGVSSAVWAWSFTTDLPRNGERSAQLQSRSLAVVMIVALIFTAGALMPYLRSTRGFGIFGPSARHSHYANLASVLGTPLPDGSPRNNFDDEQSAKGAFEKSSEARPSGTKDSDSGIVLWPKKPRLTAFVAPVPITAFSSLFPAARSATPLVIPFNGVYWFFKSPDLHPPRTSRQAHGSPEALDIHSTDRRPLSMEAHENFGSMIDVDCCSRIQIAIRNADPYPESVSLELILVNSSLPGRPSQSLGAITVKSTRSWKMYEKQSPVAEILNFPMPTVHSLRRFDEVAIVFRLNGFRAEDGAKIAIDRFVLVPRGL